MPPPPISLRSAQLAAGVWVPLTEPPPSSATVTAMVSLPPGAGPMSGRAPLQFVCTDCWHTFFEGSLATCICERPRPAAGWSAMPYLFRGRYLFVDLLGRGGMGAVFRAYDQAGEENQWVAVKVVSQTSAERAATRKEMFQKEAAAAQMLAQHKEFFVSVLGHDGVDPAYLVLEHISWPTLEALRLSHSRGGRGLAPVQVARIGIALLRGVARMHFHRIVHQDLTPTNLFVNHRTDGEGYEVKITDLGIWTHDQVQWDSESLTLVAKPSISGTPNYMSPEQSLGRTVGAASDLHTVGSVLWELATGQAPYPADIDRPPHEFLQLRVEALQNPLPRPKGMPQGLYKILSRALEFDPEARWSSAPEMCKALEAFIDHCRAERERDLDKSSGKLERVSRQVMRLEEKLASMHGLTDRLAALGAMVRQASAERDDLEPEEMHTIADEGEKELDDISSELQALAGWLSFVGGWKSKSSHPPKLDAAASEVTETLQAVSPLDGAVPAATAEPITTTSTVQKHPPAWLARTRWPLIAIAVAAVTLGAGYLVLGMGEQSPAASAPQAPSIAAPEPKKPRQAARLPDPPAPIPVAEEEAADEPSPIDSSDTPPSDAPLTNAAKADKTAKAKPTRASPVVDSSKSPAATHSDEAKRSLIQENPYK